MRIQSFPPGPKIPAVVFKMRAPSNAFSKACGSLSVRCVVSSGKSGPGRRLPLVGPGSGYRTRQEEHALPIVRDKFRLLLDGLFASIARLRFTDDASIQLFGSEERIYHRMVNSVLTGCLSRGAHFNFNGASLL